MTTGATGPTGPAMTTFYVKSRVTHPIEITTVEASTREDAIQKTLDGVDEGDTIEIMQVQESPYANEGPTGATGVTGTTGASGAARK